MARLHRGDHIVQIFAIGEADGLPFFEMEYLAGGSLDRQPSRDPPGQGGGSARRDDPATPWPGPIAQGLVHRDLSRPTSFLTADDAAQSQRFRARQVAGPGRRTDTHTCRSDGSPSYMAPGTGGGQGQGGGPPADIHALGAILYELVTGRPPFKAATHLWRP